MSKDLVFYLLLFMLVLGPIQVMMSIILPLESLYPKRRKYFAVYGLGVVAYFWGLWAWGRPISDTSKDTLFQIYFFGGAAILALYNAFVCIYGKRLP